MDLMDKECPDTDRGIGCTGRIRTSGVGMSDRGGRCAQAVPVEDGRRASGEIASVETLFEEGDERRQEGLRLGAGRQVEMADQAVLFDGGVAARSGETAGGFRLANTSSVRDGMFDCLLLEKRNFLVSCFAMVRYLCGGHPRSVRHLRAATLQISSPIDEPTDVDGQRGARFPLDVRCLPGLLRVVCPRDGRR